MKEKLELRCWGDGRWLINTALRSDAHHVESQLWGHTYNPSAGGKDKRTPGDLQPASLARVSELQERPCLIIIGYTATEDTNQVHTQWT